MFGVDYCVTPAEFAFHCDEAGSSMFGLQRKSLENSKKEEFYFLDEFLSRVCFLYSSLRIGYRCHELEAVAAELIQTIFRVNVL